MLIPQLATFLVRLSHQFGPNQESRGKLIASALHEAVIQLTSTVTHYIFIGLGHSLFQQ